MDKEQLKEEWCKKNTVNYLDELGKSQPNFDYVKKELVDGVMVETTPNDKYRPVVEEEK